MDHPLAMVLGAVGWGNAAKPNKVMVVAIERHSRMVDYCIGPFDTWPLAESAMIRERDVAMDHGQYGRYDFQLAPLKGEG